MKLFFVTGEMTELADPQSFTLRSIKDNLLAHENIEEVDSPEKADAIIIQEEKEALKNYRHIDRLLKDQLISKHLNKVFTLNIDDFSNGLLRGLYASIPTYRYNPQLYRTVPFFSYSNQLVFTDKSEIDPVYLAGWFGNTKSHKVRRTLVETLGDTNGFFIKSSQSWYNHKNDEQKEYVELIKSSKFSLCPSGWQSATFRLYESMALGRCPVIIADNFVPPAGPDWNEFALFYSTKKDISKLPSFLLQHEARHKELGEKAKENWDKYFAGDRMKEYYANTFLSLIRSTPKCTIEMETRRWKSFSTYWNNRWTIPQRVVNKCKLILEKKLAKA